MKSSQVSWKNRHIFNNIRLVFDLIDYSELIEDDGLILFLDFFKAFDTIGQGSSNLILEGRCSAEFSSSLSQHTCLEV